MLCISGQFSRLNMKWIIIKLKDKGIPSVHFSETEKFKTCIYANIKPQIYKKITCV